VHARPEFDLRTVNNRIFLTFATCLVLDGQFAVAVHDDMVAFRSGDAVDVDELDRAFGARLERRLFRMPRSGTADVEGTHRKLGTRLADGLGSDNADSFAKIDEVPPGKIAAVALGAYAPPALAGQHGAYLHLLQSGIFYPGHEGFVDLLVGRNQDLTGDRVEDVVQCDTAEDAVSDVLDDLAALGERGNQQPVEGPAIILGDDRILGHVHQPSGQVTRVGGLERRIGKALAGAVR